MPRLAPTPLHLSELEREQLQHLVNRHSTSQQIVLRAKIILQADAGQNHREIGRALNISRDMARLWRNRWLELSGKPLSVVERLTDAPRPGGPMTFSLEPIFRTNFEKNKNRFKNSNRIVKIKKLTNRGENDPIKR